MLTSLLGGRLMAERFGGAPPDVVALHGWARTRADWAPVVRDFSALAIDLPGHGATPPPDAPWGSDDYAAVIAEALDSEVRDTGHRMIILAHSFGGRVAVHLAARRPDLISGLVLTGVPLIRPEGSGKVARRFRVARKLHEFGVLSTSTMDQYRDRYGSADYRASSGVMRQVFVKVVNETYADELTALGRSGVPVQMVWGSADTAAPLSANTEVLVHVPQAELQVVDGSGHLLDRPLIDALAKVLNRELSSNTS